MNKRFYVTLVENEWRKPDVYSFDTLELALSFIRNTVGNLVSLFQSIIIEVRYS